MESETGGSSITSYVVSWDKGLGGAFTDLSGHETNDLSTDLIYLTDISSGVYYQFKYRARNTHGDGPDSDSFTILSATIPNTMIAPVISLNEDVDYRITLEQPSTGGDGVPILAYEILVQKSSGEWEVPTSCTSSP